MTEIENNPPEISLPQRGKIDTLIRRAVSLILEFVGISSIYQSFWKKEFLTREKLSDHSVKLQRLVLLTQIGYRIIFVTGGAEMVSATQPGSDIETQNSSIHWYIGSTLYAASRIISIYEKRIRYSQQN